MKIIKKIGAGARALGCSMALAGSLFLMSPVTAFAGGPDCICETKCDEEHVNQKCPICKKHHESCEGVDPEIEEKWGPLTPNGNMNLVDDYGSIEAGGKQFITVTTKNGNYFYIIIDRDDEGKETVHFLNMVDESDLLSLMDEDQVNEYIAVTGKGKAEEEDPEPVVAPPEPEPEPEPVTEPEEPVVKKDSTNLTGIMAVILIVGLAGVGGFMYFISTKNSKKKQNIPDPDEDYFDDEFKDDDEDEIKLEEEPEDSEDEETED
jgi:hypothetical protein